MNTLIQDMRYALRQLRKAPGFTFTAVLTLALGIGANAAIFTLVHAVLLRNLPVEDPKMLVRVGDTDDCCVNGGTPADNDYSIFAYDNYKALQASSPEFEQLAAVQAGGSTVTVRSSVPGALPKSSSGEYVSGNYFLTLGLKPFIGRLLVPADDEPNAAPVAVMSYQVWQRDYASDPSVIGSVFTLNTHAVTIVGITPPAFYGDRLSDAPREFFLPMALEPIMAQGESPLLHRHDLGWVYILGRIKPGTALGPLQAKMSGNLRQWLAPLETYQGAEGQKDLAQTHLVLTSGALGINQLQDGYGSGLKLLMGISALVLLIACANIANLVLVRGMARRAETSIRMALGAARKRLIRQMLTESIVLSCLGGLAGLVVAYGGTRVLLTLAFPNSPTLPISANPSAIVLGFAFGLSLLTGLIFGIAPAWVTSHSEPAEALRGTNRSTRDTSSLLQRSLVVLQAALSLVLLVAAGLLSKTLSKLEHQDFGVETTNRVVIHISPQSAGFKPAGLQALYDQIEQKFQALPGVERVGLSSYTPLEGNNWGEAVFVQGNPPPGPHDNVGASWSRVSPGFMQVIGQRVLKGRGITAQDTSTSPPVAVVNQAFVKKFFPNGRNPIGARFGLDDAKSANDLEIVGVVSDVKFQGTRRPQRAMYFRPMLQLVANSDGVGTSGLYAGAIMLQTKGAIDNLESLSRQTLAGIDPNLTVVQYNTFDGQIAGQFDQDRLMARLTLMFGLLALALAAVGLYGVTSYTVVRRTSEIGIRMALGADRSNVVGMVMREAMLQTAIGLAIGIPTALLCVRFVQAQLYNVQGRDLTVFSSATLALAISALIAGLIPARRAASTDPMTALRTE